MIIILLEWRFAIQAAGIGKTEAKVLNWVVCKVKTELGLPDPGDCPEIHSPTGYVQQKEKKQLKRINFFNIIHKKKHKIWPNLSRYNFDLNSRCHTFYQFRV